jgi:hypothetical protein
MVPRNNEATLRQSAEVCLDWLRQGPNPAERVWRVPMCAVSVADGDKQNEYDLYICTPFDTF